MDSDAFERFTARLVERLRADRGVLGLVLLGSTADPTYRDAWSDHDFWVVTRPGEQDRLLGDPSWLPDAERLLLIARHGSRRLSALYEDGHQVELAVFDPDETSTGLITTGELAFDEADVADRVAKVRVARPEPGDEARRAFLVDNFLMQLWTAVTRWRRGEQLSAHRYVAQHAVDSLLALALDLAPPAVPSASDPLDPRRRVEQVLPDLAGAIDGLVYRPVPEAALGLLDLAQPWLADRWPRYPARQATAVRSLLVSSVGEPAQEAR
jgi:hypothetical protein